MDKEPEKSSEILLRKLLHEYTTIFEINNQSEKEDVSHQLSAVLNNLLERKHQLEEVSLIKKKLVENHLPLITHQYKILQRFFKSIDNLSALVMRINSDLNRLEVCLETAHHEILGHQLPLSHRLLQPVYRKLNSVQDYEQNDKAPYDKSLIFKPSDYLDTISTDDQYSKIEQEHEPPALDSLEIDTS